MKILILMLVLLSLTTLGIAGQGLGSSTFDPVVKLPDIKTPPASPMGSPIVTSNELPDPPNFAFTRELSGYERSQSKSPASFQFATEVSRQIESLMAVGREIDEILITGFADGIPNSGIKQKGLLIPEACKQGIDGDIDDSELAYLRGCIVWNEIANLLEPKYSAIISTLRKDAYDEPDGGKSGYPYRKVLIKITLKEKKIDR
jgi:hypothetical protein